MKKKKIIKKLLIVLGVLIFLLVVLVKPVDESPLEQQDYFKITSYKLDSAFENKYQSKLPIKAGWSKKNITPDIPVRIVGYGLQKDFESIHDSLYVRTVVFSDGVKRFALVSYDLLFVHPHIATLLKAALQEKKLGIDGIYFAATHTHNSFGGWGYNRVFDKLLLDGVQDEIISKIVNQSVSAIGESINHLDVALVGQASFNFQDYIRNRIPGEEELDPWMHTMTLIHPEQKDTAIIAVFSAHATSLFSLMDSNILSGDYPGMMSQQMESPAKTFVFCAGGVASFSPMNSRSAIKETQEYATKMVNHLTDSLSQLQIDTIHTLSFFETELKMKEPSLRIADHYQLRPWVFKGTVGYVEPHFRFLRVGQMVFLGFPGEISGELYQQEITKAREKNLYLAVSSFNGNYTGYVVPDNYYYEKTCHEAREMNWFGPESGRYFSFLVKKIVNHLE